VNTSKVNIEQFTEVPIVGIVRNISPADFRELLPVYYESGLKNIEVTMNTEGAVDMLSYAGKNFSGKLNIGAGTVCNVTDLQTAIDAGARFIVTPIANEEVIKVCTSGNLPVFPGAFTPTEIYKVWTLGATMVKLFPGSSAGPQYIKEIKGPFKQIPLFPTGGIDLDNIQQFFQAGASAVGIGSNLFDSAIIKQKNWTGLLNHFQLYKQSVTADGRRQ
jgi:2-dehydro-3-deoxyphosphogluconate aldolase / (4S)-4-hydroxy-2-oxoglutarate aldolase